MGGSQQTYFPSYKSSLSSGDAHMCVNTVTVAEQFASHNTGTVSTIRFTRCARIHLFGGRGRYLRPGFFHGFSSSFFYSSPHSMGRSPSLPPLIQETLKQSSAIYLFLFYISYIYPLPSSSMTSPSLCC